MPILLATQCFVCGTPLSGGSDVYGDADREVCLHCHLTGTQTPDERANELVSRQEEVIEEINTAEYARDLFEDESTQKRLDQELVKFRNELAEIQKELDGLGIKYSRCIPQEFLGW